MATKTPQELWLLALEAERHDMSWKNPQRKEQHAPVEVIVRRELDPREQKKRDRTMFHAGRFAMGARDDDAIRGNIEAAKLINKKGNK